MHRLLDEMLVLLGGAEPLDFEGALAPNPRGASDEERLATVLVSEFQAKWARQDRPSIGSILGGPAERALGRQEDRFQAAARALDYQKLQSRFIVSLAKAILTYIRCYPKKVY